MAIYLISYDLIPPGQHYKNVHDAIKSVNPYSWAKPLESVWLVESNASATVIRDHIWKACDRNDKLFVIEVKKNAAGYNLPDNVWKWLNSKLF